MTIVSSDITSPACLEVDYRETTGSKRRVYWADSSLGKLESANLNGGERRVVKQMLNTKFFDMALFRVSTVINEPRREKTGRRDFGPGLTQTDLYSHRSGLEA